MGVAFANAKSSSFEWRKPVQYLALVSLPFKMVQDWLMISLSPRLLWLNLFIDV